LTTQDYELKLTKKYHPWEYICQFRETDFDFISRWMEREGIYYFFEQGEENEKLIITDNSTVHKDIAGLPTIPYFPPSGLAPEEEAIKAFFCRQKRLPNKVILNDYNYRKPSLELKADTVVDKKGRGNVYFYGEHFKTPEEGHALAIVRAEEIRCRENLFHGEGTQPALRPGFIFEIAGHYRESYNQKYLIAEIEHRGGQAKAFMTGTGDELAEGEKQPTYVNAFTAIPAGVQFRPERNTTKPRFYGTMNAKVDAAGIGQYAEIDDEGRYKVKLPFDQNGNGGGKASRWVRMVQPYAGADHGMHFPLHKGTEVLLTFVDGDPDRPIIAGAVPNAETKSVVTSLNATRNTIRSAGGNMLEMQDMAGLQRVLLSTPHDNTYLHMGAPNSPTLQWEQSTMGSKLIRADKDLFIKAGKGDDAYNYEKTVERTGNLTENICQGKYKQTIENTGDLTETVEGNKTETVKKDYTGTVEGNKTETVKKDYSGTIEGNKTETVKKDYSGTIEGNKTETVKMHYNRTIEGNKTETINGERTINVQGKTIKNVYDDDVEYNAGAKAEFYAGAKSTMQAGADSSMFAGPKTDIKLATELIMALALTLKIEPSVSLNIGGIELELKSGPTIVKKGLEVESRLTKLESGQAVIANHLMQIHT
jgi:type VI secretion system secreted protein VgrG